MIFFFLIPSLYLAFQQTPQEHNHAAAAAASGGELSAPPTPAVMSCLRRREHRGVGPAGHGRPRAAPTPTTVSSSQVFAGIGVSQPRLREPAAAKSPGTAALVASVFLAGRWRGGSSPDPTAPAASSPGDGGAGARWIPRRRRLPRREMEGRLLRRDMEGRLLVVSRSSGSERLPRWPDRAESGADVRVERRCGAGSGAAVDFF